MTRTLAATAIFAVIATQALAGPFEGNYFPEFPSTPSRDGRPDSSITTNGISKPPLRRGVARPAPGAERPGSDAGRDMPR